MEWTEPSTALPSAGQKVAVRGRFIEIGIAVFDGTIFEVNGLKVAPEDIAEWSPLEGGAE
jgi:hypothetical protein